MCMFNSVFNIMSCFSSDGNFSFFFPNCWFIWIIHFENISNIVYCLRLCLNVLYDFSFVICIRKCKNCYCHLACNVVYCRYTYIFYGYLEYGWQPWMVDCRKCINVQLPLWASMCVLDLSMYMWFCLCLILYFVFN